MAPEGADLSMGQPSGVEALFRTYPEHVKKLLPLSTMLLPGQVLLKHGCQASLSYVLPNILMTGSRNLLHHINAAAKFEGLPSRVNTSPSHLMTVVVLLLS